MEIKIFNVLYKIVIGCKIELKKANPFSSQMYNFWGVFLLKNWIIKLCYYLHSNFVYMSSRKNSRGFDGFSVNELENNDTSGNTETALYC